MSDQDASNALVATVRFYSDALARATERAARAEEFAARLARPNPERDEVIAKACELARVYESDFPVDDVNRRLLLLDLIAGLTNAVDRYRVGRVEPAPAHPGPVREAPPDGSPDVPR